MNFKAEYKLQTCNHICDNCAHQKNSLCFWEYRSFIYSSNVSAIVLHVYLLCTGSDACYLLKMLFLLAVHSSYNCTSELIKCIEAFTQHTIQ